MRQPAQQTADFFTSRFVSNFMLPACSLGMQLKNSLQFHFDKISRNQLRITPTGDLGGLTLRALQRYFGPFQANTYIFLERYLRHLRMKLNLVQLFRILIYLRNTSEICFL